MLVFHTAGEPARAQPAAESNGDGSRIERYKAVAVEGVDARRKLAQVVNDTVFSFGELAYQEFETSKYLTDLLEKNGFTVTRGVAVRSTSWP